METKQPGQLIQTGLQIEHLDKQHDDQIPYTINNQIDHLAENIKFYATLILEQLAPTAQIEDFKKRIIRHLNILYSEQVHTHELEDFQHLVSQVPNRKDYSDWPGYQKIDEFARILKQLMNMRADIENEQEFVKTSKIIQGFLRQMQIIVEQDRSTISRLQNYDPYSNNIDKSCDFDDRSVIELKPNHYWKQQKIIFKPELSPQVFTWVQPPLHRVYLSQVTKVYHQIVPFKIKYISLSSIDEPKIQTPNYFKEQIEAQKAIILYCKPGTNSLYSYRLNDICKMLTIQKQFISQRQLPISWKFSKYTNTLVTPQGRIFAINCKTSPSKIDSSMYEITDQKVSSKGRRPDPKFDSAFVYANKCLYIIGGNNGTQNCSKKNYKYSLKQKKWKQIADSNVALKKPTVCSFRDRFIIKLGGINQFDYINKVIEIYDTQKDVWSMVRTSPKNVLEEIQILEDSCAVQICQDQIYIFGGKNSNNYQKDTGFVLQIMEMREKIGKPLKAVGELWNVSIGKKNVFSFFGLFSQANVITHNNCLYALRVSSCKSMSH